jgi:hypothetical protein
MLYLTRKDQKAQQVCIHYAEKHHADSLIPIIECKASVTSREKAEKLSRFFWMMLQASAEDRDKGIEVWGETDLQH